MSGEIVVAPVSMAGGVKGRAEYQIVLCGECDQQVERSQYGDGRYDCPVHGSGLTVRFAMTRTCVLVLGGPIAGGED